MPTTVTAVIGACAPERQDYARRLARRTGAHLLPAGRITEDADAVELAVQLADQGTAPAPLVLEYPLQVPVLHIIGELTAGPAEAELTDVVCLVDAAHLLDDLRPSDQVQLAGPQDEAPVGASRAELVVTQIEYSSAVVLVNTESLRAEELSMLLAVVSHVAPKAHLDLAESSGPAVDHSTTGHFSDEQTHAGWVSLLNGDFTPGFEDPRVSAIRYEQLRPFHPGRLQDVLDRYTGAHMSDGMLLRSAGFCHLATRSHITAHWNQIGEHMAFFPACFDHQLDADDEPLAFGQDLGMITIGVNSGQLVSQLDGAALTDAELAGGPRLWETFSDPYPEWSTADH